MKEERSAAIDKKLWGFLFPIRRLWSSGRGRCLARFQCLIHSSHLQGLVHRHLYCWTLEKVTQTTCLQFKRKCFLLQFPFFCQIPYFFLKVFVSVNKSFFFVKTLSGTTLPVSTLCLWKNLSWITSSRTTSPVSEPLRLNFVGWLCTPNALTLLSRSVR